MDVAEPCCGDLEHVGIEFDDIDRLDLGMEAERVASAPGPNPICSTERGEGCRQTGKWAWSF